jgi:hypothetical protein
MKKECEFAKKPNEEQCGVNPPIKDTKNFVDFNKMSSSSPPESTCSLGIYIELALIHSKIKIVETRKMHSLLNGLLQQMM